MKRLGVLYLHHAQRNYGYISYLITDLLGAVDECVLVCGKGSDAIRDTVIEGLGSRAHAVRIDECPTYLHAYYQAYRILGSAYFAGYDEVLFVDSALFGPFVPFCEILGSMELRSDLDFWSITKCGMTPLGRHSRSPFRERPEHAQLYCFAARRRLLADPDFETFLKQTHECDTPEETLDIVEAVFTPYFAGKQYRWGTYVDEEGLVRSDVDAGGDVSVTDPFELVSKRGMPFLRQESLLTPRSRYLVFGTQDSVRDVLDYVRKSGVYDVGLIYEWLLAEVDLWQIQGVAGAFELVSTEEDGADSALLHSMAVVAVVSTCEGLQVIRSLPRDVYLVVVSNDVTLEDVNAVRPGENLVLSQEGPTPDACFLHACKAARLCERFTYVAGILDAGEEEREYVTLGRRYQSHVVRNAFDGEAVLAGIGRLFRDQPELGVLGVMPPEFASYFAEARPALAAQSLATLDVLKELDCKLPDESTGRLVPPVRGFWCRSELLALLLDRSVEDAFPWWLAACMPYYAQAQGYTTKYALDQRSAAAHLATTEYEANNLVRVLNRFRQIHANETFERFEEDVRAYVRIPRLHPKRVRNIRRLRAKKRQEYVLPPQATRIQRNINATLSSPRFNEYIGKEWKKNKRLATVFANARLNAVDWLPFASTDTVIEVGADYGEYTQALATRVRRVIACVPDEVHRAIVANRCRKHSNVELLPSVEVLLQNCGDTEADWLVVHDLEGVFHTRAEVEDFVVRAGKVVSPRNIVFLCSNRNGVRYATESWLVDKAELNADVERIDLRFDRDELRALFATAGYAGCSFFYPHPDYVFTKTVFTDQRPATSGSIKSGQVWRLKGERLQTSEEREALTEYANEGVFEDKCNSYLVVASHDLSELEGRMPLYVRFPSDRKIQYSMRTEILANGDVRKTCMNSAGRGHLQNIRRYTPLLRERYASVGITLDPIEFSRDSMRYTYIEGTDLQAKMVELVQEERIEEFRAAFEEYLRRIEQSHDDGYFAPSHAFASVFGRPKIPSDAHCVGVSNIDVNVDNIIVASDGSFHMIDCEWIFDFPVPTIYILWRIIYFFFSRFSFDDRMMALRDELYERYGIDETMWATYRKMETSFQRYMGL